MIRKIIFGILFSTGLNAGVLDFLTQATSAYTECNTNSKNKFQTCDIFLKDEITSPETYQDIKKLVLTLTPADTVILHLAGNGGDGAGMVYILNALKTSKVHVIGDMEGSIASAHVFLLTASDEINIDGEGYLLFHAISGTNEVEDECAQQSGKDRGLAKYTKCIEDETKIVNIYNKILTKYAAKYLTKEEMSQYLAGHDIIIDSEDFKKRLK